MKWPGLKLASRNWNPWIRNAREVAEDNALMSSPVPDQKEIQRVVVRVTKALLDLEKAVVVMLTGKRRKP